MMRCIVYGVVGSVCLLWPGIFILSQTRMLFAAQNVAAEFVFTLWIGAGARNAASLYAQLLATAF